MTTTTMTLLPLRDRRLPTMVQRMAGPVEAGPESGTITGTACLYGVPVDRGYGLWIELVAGCFAEQVPHAARVKVLWQHETDEPIGKLSELVDSPVSLRFTGRIEDTPKIPEAEKALELLRREVIDEVSVGFRIQRYERVVDEEADTVTYRVTRAHLMELSVVTWGAMGPDASVEDVFGGGGPGAAMARRIRAELLRGEMALARRW
jgi:uncharacterized protein